MFKDTLNKLLSEKGVNKSQLSINTDTSIEIINKWLDGAELPKFNDLIKLKFFFQVSSDYLLGLEDESGAKTYINNSFNNFSNNGNFKI